MNSILQKNEFIECPNCRTLIGSFAPVCGKCGLKASESGIQELAVINERNENALAEAENLLLFALSPYSMLGLAYVIGGFVPEFAVTSTAASAICLCMFWWKFSRWIQIYRNIPFPDDNFDVAKRTTTKAGIVGSVATVLVILFVYWKVA
jgi:hypothetical protein